MKVVAAITDGLIHKTPAIEPATGDSTQEKEPKACPRAKSQNESKPTRKQNVSTHFPEDPNCDTCKTTETTRARCLNRTETCRDGMVLHRKCGQVITADQKALSEDSESVLQHRYAVVLQDFCS